MINLSYKKISKILKKMFIFMISFSMVFVSIFPYAKTWTNKISDYNTMDSYLNNLVNDENGSRYAGRIWADKSVFNDNISLDMETDGFNGTIINNSDFLHVYSALGSSLNFENKLPVNIVFIIDMSGSMGMDIVDNEEHNDSTTRIQHSRIQKVVNSINDSIDFLMKNNTHNQASVVVYGAISYTLMSLGHYEKVNDKTPYITVEDFTVYNEQNFENPEDSFSSSGGCAYTLRFKAKKNEETIENSVRNNYTESMKESKVEKLDACIGYNTNLQVGIYQGFEELYKNMQTIENVSYTYYSPSDNTKVVVPRIPMAVIISDGGSNFFTKRDTQDNSVGDEWYNVQNYLNIESYSSNKKLFRAEESTINMGGKETIVDILLTAAFMKAKVVNQYEKLLAQAGIDQEQYSTSFKISTVSVDTPNVNWQVPRLFATLNPEKYFKNQLPDDITWEFKQEVIDAYELFEEWKNSSDYIISEFKSSDYNEKLQNTILLRINKLDKEVDGVTNEDVINNINYNDNFSDISSSDMVSYFKSLISSLDIQIFRPLSGYNSLGYDSVTYNDLIGEYMEIKDKAVNVSNKTYDMALLLFGKIYGINKIGVFDNNFIQEQSSDGTFISGWYDKDGNYKSTGNWDDGDVFYVDKNTLSEHLSSIKKNQELTNEQKDTVYTLYDFVDGNNIEFVNLCYGEKNNNVKYKLSDIQIWQENKKNFSASKNENNLFVNFPVNVLPLEVVTVLLNEDGSVFSYNTNLDNKILSTPFRLFYGVGIDESIFLPNSDIVNPMKIDSEYLAKNMNGNEISFYSNYFSNSLYTEYSEDVSSPVRGDTFVSFSPSDNNRYYLFQKNLLLYTHAYTIKSDGTLEHIDNSKTFKGAVYAFEYSGKTENNKVPEEVVEKVKEDIKNGKLKEGNVITLNEDIIKYRTNVSANKYYYMVTDYYKLEQGEGKQIKYIIPRLGSLFGLGDLGNTVSKESYVSWIDKSAKYEEVYDYNQEIPSSKLDGNWVLSTKIGGLRVGDLHQNIENKIFNETNTSSNNYLPIVATSSATKGVDAIINEYLGNNGKITFNIAEIEQEPIPENPYTGSFVSVMIMIFFIVCLFVILIFYSKYKKKNILFKL